MKTIIIFFLPTEAFVEEIPPYMRWKMKNKKAKTKTKQKQHLLFPSGSRKKTRKELSSLFTPGIYTVRSMDSASLSKIGLIILNIKSKSKLKAITDTARKDFLKNEGIPRLAATPALELVQGTSDPLSAPASPPYGIVRHDRL